MEEWYESWTTLLLNNSATVREISYHAWILDPWNCPILPWVVRELTPLIFKWRFGLECPPLPYAMANMQCHRHPLIPFDHYCYCYKIVSIHTCQLSPVAQPSNTKHTQFIIYHLTALRPFPDYLPESTIHQPLSITLHPSLSSSLPRPNPYNFLSWKADRVSLYEALFREKLWRKLLFKPFSSLNVRFLIYLCLSGNCPSVYLLGCSLLLVASVRLF